MFGHGNDQLKEALMNRQSKASFRNMFQSSNPFFKEQKFDFEYFGLSFTKRILSFIFCLVFGLILFFYSLYRAIFAAFNPGAFVVPYVISNLLFFAMFGFITGFKTYTKNLFSKGKRNFSIAFVASTLTTLYVAFILKKKLWVMFFGLIQVFSFMSFMITFVPGGTTGLTSFLNMLLRGVQ